MKTRHWLKKHRRARVLCRWLKKRNKGRVFLAAAGGLVVLWLLFPPALHRRLNGIRKMQRDADSHMLSFLQKVRANPPPRPGLMDIEAFTHYYGAMDRGPLGEMPLLFDVNRYFERFDRLRMQDTYTLDYVYCSTGNHAYPLLYARTVTDAPLPDVPAFERAFGRATDQKNVSNACLGRIRADGSRQSFIQLTALHLVGDQFYLYWHAKYNDTKILSRLPAWVNVSSDQVAVSLFCFSKWGGLVRYTLTLRRAFPHTIVDERLVTVVPYNCGIRY